MLHFHSKQYQDFSEEEIEIEEEIEYIDDIEEEPPAEENEVDSGENEYKPETFEELNAMYRPKGYQAEEHDDNRTQSKLEPETYSYRSPYQTSFKTPTTTTTATNYTLPQFVREEPLTENTIRSNTLSQTPTYKPAIFEAPPPPPLVEAKIDVATKPSSYLTSAPTYSPSHSSDDRYSSSRFDEKKYSPPKVEENKYSASKFEEYNYSPPKFEEKRYSPPKVEEMKYSPSHFDDGDKYTSPRSEKKEESAEEPKPTKREVTYDMDYRPEDEIDYDEDDIYDDEEGEDDDSEELDDDDLLDDDDDDDDEEDDEEGQDVSDVDDTELMNRLEAKYGKLPAKEFESDEDPDDPTWTRNY